MPEKVFVSAISAPASKRAITRGNNADTDDDIQILFNGDSTASYTYKQLSGNGTSATSGGDVSQTSSRVVRAAGATAQASAVAD